jgi:DNA replication licensing factor MCM7
MTVHLYESLVRSCNPGDIVDIAGIFLPTPYTGFRGLRAGLIADTYLEAQHVRQMKKQYAQMQATPAVLMNLQQIQMLILNWPRVLHLKFMVMKM